MDSSLAMVVLVSAGTAITVATIVYQAGKLQGSITQRMDDFDRRLIAIEEWLMKLGVRELRRSDIPRRQG